MKALIVLICFSSFIQAQNLERHQWKNRVVVISGNSKNIEKIEKQFEVFQTKKEELLERKLVVYKCHQATCKFYDWVSKPQEIQLENTPKKFEIKLYGLDGGEKFQSEKVTTSKKIFDLIDSMPMRQSEIRNKND